MNIKLLSIKQKAFTLIELLIGIAIIGILALIALPSLGQFTVGLRVDSEMSELHRLILTARNTAINTGNSTIICPIVSNVCANEWDKEISVIEDVDGSGDFTAGDIIIKVKAPINGSDQLISIGNLNLLRFSPTGILSNSANDTNFNYCPSGYTEQSKGITVSPLGRPYISQDTDDDGYDEDWNGNNITCS